MFVQVMVQLTGLSDTGSFSCQSFNGYCRFPVGKVYSYTKSPVSLYTTVKISNLRFSSEFIV